MPWITMHDDATCVFKDSWLETQLQEFVPLTLSQQHTGKVYGACCANGECSRCGLHPTTIAALHTAMDMQGLIDPRSAYNRWIKLLSINKDIISRNLQMFEILIVVDFILKGGKDLYRLELPHLVQQYATFVWTLVGVFKTCGLSHYSLVQTKELADYDA